MNKCHIKYQHNEYYHSISVFKKLLIKNVQYYNLLYFIVQLHLYFI